MKRRAPKKVDVDAWRAFEVWADGAGIGELRADWGPWWACWEAGYDYATGQAWLNA